MVTYMCLSGTYIHSLPILVLFRWPGMEEEESVVHSKVLTARTALCVLTIDRLSILCLMIICFVSLTKYFKGKAQVLQDYCMMYHRVRCLSWSSTSRNRGYICYCLMMWLFKLMDGSEWSVCVSVIGNCNW